MLKRDALIGNSHLFIHILGNGKNPEKSFGVEAYCNMFRTQSNESSFNSRYSLSKTTTNSSKRPSDVPIMEEVPQARSTIRGLYSPPNQSPSAMWEAKGLLSLPASPSPSDVQLSCSDKTWAGQSSRVTATSQLRSSSVLRLLKTWRKPSVKATLVRVTRKEMVLIPGKWAPQGHPNEVSCPLWGMNMYELIWICMNEYEYFFTALLSAEDSCPSCFILTAVKIYITNIYNILTIFVALSVCTLPCSPHHHPSPEHFYLSHLKFCSHETLTSNHHLTSCLFEFALLGPHVQYLSSGRWFISQSTVFKVHPCYSLCMYSIVKTDHILFTHSSVAMYSLCQ